MSRIDPVDIRPLDDTGATVSDGEYVADVVDGVVVGLVPTTSGVPTSRTLTAGTGLTGGGDLTADRTFAIDTTTEAERIRDVIGAALVAGTNVTISVNDAGDTITINASGGGGGGGTVLASTAYNPASLTSYAINSTTVTDLDATNLAVTFTAPTSGAVIVTLNALVTSSTAGTGHYLTWNLRDGSTTIATEYIIGSAAQDNVRLAGHFKITGLTSGVAYTFKWAQSRQTTGTFTTHAGGLAGAAVMVVHSA